MNDLLQTWEALEAHANDDTLNAWLAAARDFLADGGTLPPEMVRRYQLATGAQTLPPVVVTDAVPVVPWLAAAALAWWLVKR